MATGIINQQITDPNATPKTVQPGEDMLTPAAGIGAPPATQAAAPTGIINAAASSPDAGTIASAPATTPASAAPAPDYTGQVQDAYHKYLGRTGEQAGVDFFSNILKSGGSMDTVDKDFLASDEYKSLHPMPGQPVRAAQLGAPTQWTVTPDQTVQGQMMKEIDPNNPYYQQWATAGAQDAAARGFTGNSSIRDTGIMDSVMRGATPIATSDASTYAKSAGYNADEANQFAVKNADMANQMTLGALSANTQKYVSDQSSETQKSIAHMSNQSQQLISQAHDANSVLLASNDAAKNAYTNYVAAVAQIDQNDKMDSAAKQAAIITQTQLFNSTIAGLKGATPGTADITSPLDINPQPVNTAAQQVGGVDVSKFLNF